jgi:hypothetical protein
VNKRIKKKIQKGLLPYGFIERHAKKFMEAYRLKGSCTRRKFRKMLSSKQKMFTPNQTSQNTPA